MLAPEIMEMVSKIVKVTITNYNLWTIASAKFEVSSLCSHGNVSQNVPALLVIKIAAHAMKHYYVCCMQKSILSSPFMQNIWPHPLNQWARWLSKHWKETCGSSRRWKDKHVYVDKIEQRSSDIPTDIASGPSKTLIFLKISREYACPQTPLVVVGPAAHLV